MTFDAYGDQATAGSRSYTYDALGRLTADVATATGTGNSFSYAGKSSAIAADGAATYTWDPSGATLVGTGAPGGGSGALALTDAHGDVLGQFAPAATAMTGSQAYDPWGTVTATTGSLSGGLGFQGAWTDPAAGKDLMGARWYAPSAGDFTSADTVQVPPVPDPAAGSPYAYAADDPLSGTDPTGHLVAMLPDGGNYYRTAPAPARPVTPPPPPPSYYAQQAVQAFTAMTHSMGSAKPADARKAVPAPKTAAKARPVTRPAQSSLDACSGDITACLAGYIRYNGGQVNQQGTVTLTGYHPGPANPGTCGTRICYNILTGRAVKITPLPAASHGCGSILKYSLMDSRCKAAGETTEPGNDRGGIPKTQCLTQSTYCAPSETQLNDGSQADTGNERDWDVAVGECLSLGLGALCVDATTSGSEDSGSEGGAPASGDNIDELANIANTFLDAAEEAQNEGYVKNALRELGTTRVTTGRIFDAEGNVVGPELTSGNSALGEAAQEFLRSSPDFPDIPAGAEYSIATHVETQYAMLMREEGITNADVVINNTKGICTGDMSCTAAVRAILPRGSTMNVWSPGADAPVSLPGVGPAP